MDKWYWATYQKSRMVPQREAFKLKDVPKSGKSPKGGEGSAPEIKKSTIQNVDFLIRGGGETIFSFFPQM